MISSSSVITLSNLNADVDIIGYAVQRSVEILDPPEGPPPALREGRQGGSLALSSALSFHGFSAPPHVPSRLRCLALHALLRPPLLSDFSAPAATAGSAKASFALARGQSSLQYPSMVCSSLFSVAMYCIRTVVFIT